MTAAAAPPPGVGEPASRESSELGRQPVSPLFRWASAAKPFVLQQNW